MSRPAFRTTYYQNYPPPFYPGASGQYPVPGWGVKPVMAGPARVGVGAAMAARTAPSQMTMQQSSKMAATLMDTSPPKPAKPFPWVWIFSAAGLLGGGLALAYNFRLIGKKR